ncbi:uncharacterized protein LY89DRAFT_711244 [Mollisia scopiformis]|uniref:CENP-V/GFA domain-containing protein n=1 Tax=Mollisia scopiformis TaxID=149040 RepID=A0A132BAS3_MOLSC|nr:uncharacterized protein LY89DRAFT_711244 [Mollisia scopiformis]KUJ09478.1 hypothetical protein LY89DRAFT_711244 [Mollisia scopiformis]
MPLPDHAFTLHGGCNCRAIRYKIEVPAFKDRFMHPTRDQAHLPEREKIRFPMSLVCHCNDCRRGTGALITYAFACLNSYVSFQIESRSKKDSDKNEWIPAAKIFPPAEFKEKDDTFLEFYASTDARRRSFCSRCGVSLTYNSVSMPEPWPAFLDVWTGTIDSEDLEKDWLIPVRHCWIDVEIPWIGKLACQGSGGIPRHEGGSDFQ